jgi:large subunit ribosomal protein L3
MKGLGLIGQKLGMTTIFAEDGTRVPVTVIKAGPCPVIQVKDKERDGYEAVQVGFEEIPPRKVTKPQRGHQDKAGQGYFRQLKEFRTQGDAEFDPGQELTVDLFSIGERVNVSGRSKGRGFAGVMKRWNFGGLPASHGHHKVHRSTGAIGQCADPARVFKGKKMPGQLGNKKVTVSNAEIVDIRAEDGVLLLRGQVPGPKKSFLTIRKKS